MVFLATEWARILKACSVDSECKNFVQMPPCDTVFKVLSNYKSFCVNLFELVTFISGIVMSGRPMPLQDTSNLVHIDCIGRTILCFGECANEDEVKCHDEKIKLMCQSARQIITAANGAASDVKAVIIRRKAHFLKESGDKKKALSAEDRKARTLETKLKKQAEREIEKHALHPILAYKGQGGNGVLSYPTFDDMKKGSHDPSLPFIIDNPTAELVAVLDDGGIKKAWFGFLAASRKTKLTASSTSVVQVRNQ